MKRKISFLVALLLATVFVCGSSVKASEECITIQNVESSVPAGEARLIETWGCDEVSPYGDYGWYEDEACQEELGFDETVTSVIYTQLEPGYLWKICISLGGIFDIFVGEEPGGSGYYIGGVTEDVSAVTFIDREGYEEALTGEDLECYVYSKNEWVTVLHACGNGATINDNEYLFQDEVTFAQYELDSTLTDYYKAKTGVGEKYYLYDIVMNKTELWDYTQEHEVYGEVSNGELKYNGDYYLPDLEFKKGYAYAISAEQYNSDDTIDIEMASSFLNLYTGGTSTIRNNSDFYYSTIELYTYYFGDRYEIENVKESVLANDFDIKVREIFPDFIYEDGNLVDGNIVFFVPNTDITLTHDDSMNVSSYATLRATVCSAEITGLDYVKPEFDNVDVIFPVNVDNPESISSILSKIHASDNVDGSVTVKLESTTYDPNNLVLGSHDFVVSATDTAGNTNTLTCKVNVYDIVAPTAKVTSKSISYTKVLTSEEVIALVTASDNFTSKTQLRYVVDKNAYAAYTTASTNLGTYKIPVMVLDEADNSVTAEVIVEVIDDVSPVATVATKSVGASTMLTDTQILALVTATDAKSLNVTKTIISRDYTANNYAEVGTHSVIIRSEDDYGNYIDSTVYITVYDDMSPVLTNSTISVLYNKKLTEDEIKNGINISDNNTELTAEDIILDASDLERYYLNYNKLGTYTILAEAFDGDGNVGSCTVTITVYDNLAPAITAPSLITAGTSVMLDASKITSKISVVDGYDGTILDYTIQDLDKYSTNYAVVGKYDFKILATDAQGNTSSFSFVIEVSDDMAPDFWLYSNYVITIQKGTEITKEMIINYLAQVAEIDASQVETVSYAPTAGDAPGVYACRLLMRNGEIYDLNLAVEEIATPEEEDPFTFGDLFTKEYWESLWNKTTSNYTDVNNIFNFKNFTWINWVFDVFGLLLVIAIIVAIIRKK